MFVVVLLPIVLVLVFHTFCQDPHLPAALMKQWLRDLPTPLFPDYARCLSLTKLVRGSEEEAQAYRDLLLSLSAVHRNVAMYLMEFLTDLGDPANVPHTKMPLQNLTLVFVPSFLRCPSHDVTTVLMNQPTEQLFVQTCVDYFLLPSWKEPLMRAIAELNNNTTNSNSNVADASNSTLNTSASASVAESASITSSED
jgi:hypothetical protein